MAHMQPDIRTGAYWEIEGSDGGTYFVPTEVTGPIMAPEQLRDYAEADIDEVRLAETEDDQVLGRLSAPGYLDCTDWNLYDSRAEALEEMEVAVRFTVPAWAIGMLVNGDTNGISEDEQRKVEALIERENGLNWGMIDIVGEEEHFAHDNDVDGIAGNVVDVLVMLRDGAIA